jgi:hypothetical protein
VESAIWGLVGTLVGTLASIGTTWISGRNASNLQNQSAKLGRLEKERSFQRETLIELQDALHDTLRMMGRAHLEETVSHKQSGRWGSSLLSEEVNEGMRLSNRKVAILIERIADNQLRTELKALMKISNGVVGAGSQAEAETKFVHTIAAYNSVSERLGDILRSLY